jgi:hypothetical protein
MRSSIKVSLTGLLIAGALAFSAVAAMGTGGGGTGGGGNVGGNPGIPYNGGGYQANTDRHFGHTYHNSHGGYGTYHGGY